MRAVYALSADPLTNGHIDIIKRAKKMFSQVVVAIGTNPHKKYLFSLAERVSLAQTALKELSGVSVQSFSGLLVDFAYEQTISVIIRGLRTAEDYQFETQLFATGLSQQRGIETVCLLASPGHSHVSSSMVKELQLNQGLVQEFVPLVVKAALEKKLSQQTFVGVTGEMAAGKSYLIAQLIKHLQTEKIPAHHIDFDQLAKEVLFSKTEPRYVLLRQELAADLGLPYTDDSSAAKQNIADALFSSTQLQEQLRARLVTPLLTYLRTKLIGKTGIIFLESALLAEWELFHLVNNQIIMVESQSAEQAHRLSQRQLKKSEIKVRLDAQFSFRQKLLAAQKIISQDGQGRIWQVSSPITGSQIKTLAKELSSI